MSEKPMEPEIGGSICSLEAALVSEVACCVKHSGKLFFNVQNATFCRLMVFYTKKFPSAVLVPDDSLLCFSPLKIFFL